MKPSKALGRVHDAAALASILLALGEAGSRKLTLMQGAFFFKAAHADAMGRPQTRSEILEGNPEFKAGLKNTYRQLLEPSRLYPSGLGWLRAEENPLDAR